MDQDSGKMKQAIKEALMTSNVMEEIILEKNSPENIVSPILQLFEKIMFSDKFITAVADKLAIILTTNEKFTTELANVYEKKSTSTMVQTSEEIKKLSKQQEEAEQYSRRNCLLFHGIPQKDKEDTDDVIVKFMQDKLNLDIKKHEIDRSHRLKGTSAKNPRPIIVKLARHNIKQQIYFSKKELKGTKFLITESLTSERLKLMKILKKKKDEKKIVAYWSTDGKIFVKEEKAEEKRIVENMHDAENL